MPEPVPSLEDIESNLAAGAAPGVPEPVPILDDDSGGISIATAEKLDPSVPTQDPDLEQIQADHQLLMAELETANKRVADNQANFHQANQGRQFAEEVVQVQREEREREAQWMQQVQASQPPSVDKPDDLLDDGEALQAHLHNLAQWSVGAAMAQARPLMEEVRKGARRLAAMHTVAKELATDRARDKISTMGFDDFDELKEGVDQQFSAWGEEGIDLQLIPQNIVNAYLMERNRRNLPMTGTGGAKPPTVTPSNPSLKADTHSEALERVKHLSPYAKQIAGHLGLEGGKLEVTVDDLNRVGL